MQKGLLSFEDDDLDAAYKLLEATEKFCDPSRRFAARLRLGNSLDQITSSPHQRLLRRSIVADCLLFEAIIVFLKQGFSSYVKGGYILRKAWKMYDKINEEMEEICTTPCPIVQNVTSPLDKHVGTSVYDQNGDVVNEQNGSDETTGDDTVDALSGSLPGLLSDLGEVAERMEEEIGKDEPKNDAVINGDDVDLAYVPDLAKQNSGTELLGSASKNSSGYDLPEIVDCSIKSLDDDDSRLRGGVYFGYGLMNIIVSLIPPKLMKLANLFGFRGSRKVGLQALEYACHSQDMKAPLARWVWLVY